MAKQAEEYKLILAFNGARWTSLFRSRPYLRSNYEEHTYGMDQRLQIGRIAFKEKHQRHHDQTDSHRRKCKNSPKRESGETEQAVQEPLQKTQWQPRMG